jgi:hypothetical protein
MEKQKFVWSNLVDHNNDGKGFPELIGPAMRSSRRNRHAWATGGFAIAVFGGTLGCLLLLLRRSAAYNLFIALLLGVIVTMTHALGVGIDFGLGEILGIILMPLAVAAFLI